MFHRKLLASTFLIATLSPAGATVRLADYGLGSIEPTAVCVSQRITSAASGVVAHYYYSPVTQIRGTCQPPRMVLNELDIGNARSAFLTALNSCTGQNYTDDATIWVRQVADGAAIIAADGIRDGLTGESLLSKFNRGSNICNPQPQKK